MDQAAHERGRQGYGLRTCATDNFKNVSNRNAEESLAQTYRTYLRQVHARFPTATGCISCCAHPALSANWFHSLDAWSGPGKGGTLLRSTTPVTRSLRRDRKSTRLNSSHLGISYAVF